MTEGTIEPLTDEPLVEPRLGDLVVAGVVLYLLIANAPNLYRGSPILLAVALWPLGAVGLVGCAILAWRGSVAARWGAGFVAWALVATLASDQPWISLQGGWFGDRGWVYLACFVGCWAVGRRRGASAVTWVTGALVLGLVLNALIAFLQTTVPDGEGLISLQEGRAKGFTINPVYLGGLMAGGVALLAQLTARSTHRRWYLGAGALVLMAGAANLSGSRIAIVATLALGPAAAVVAARRGPSPWLRVGMVVGAIAFGLVLGALVLPTGGTGRVADGAGGGGVTNRTLMWRAGAEATLERPLVGWGPNRFRPATSHAITAEFRRNEGMDGEYPDAHNVLVEVATTTGIPGLVLLLGFAWTAARRARGPLAWYAAGVAVTWLFEPITDATVPTAMLALGLAALGAQAAPDPPLARPVPRMATRVVAAGLATVGFIAAGRLLVIDYRMDRAYESEAVAAAIDDVRRTVAPTDLAVNSLLTESLIQRAESTGSRADARAAVVAAERTLDIDPTLPKAHVDLGRARMVAAGGDEEGLLDARAAFLAALDQNPWSTAALDGLLAVDIELGRDADVERWKDALCEVRGCEGP